MEKILNFLDKFQTVLWPSIIAIYIGCSKAYRELKRKRLEMLREDDEKTRKRNSDLFLKWEHTESMEVISMIKSTCNMIKDKSSADRVSYFQLENGTIAISEVCNMFMTCLCEDNRYSNLHKELTNLQRVPYSKVDAWISELTSKDQGDRSNSALTISQPVESEILTELNSLYSKEVNSHMSMPIYNSSGIFIGACVMEYALPNYNGVDYNKELEYLNELRISIESILTAYYEKELEKRKELKLDAKSFHYCKEVRL